MRVLIAAASFASNISGLQRHAFNMAHCLLNASEITAVHFVVAPWQVEMVGASGLQTKAKFTLHVAEMDRDSVGRNAWYYRRLPHIAEAVRADVVHLTYPMPVNALAFRCPTVVTLHDLYPFEIPMNFGFPKFIFNRMALRQCLGAVTSIACVSEATRRQLQKYLPAFSEKAVRIYNCIEPQHQCSDTYRIEKWRNDPFLLCVAQHRKNKNLGLLIRTFKRLLTGSRVPANTKLMIVGISGPETRRISSLISQLGLSDCMYLEEGLSEGELQWCYRQCEALVSPSITEGFGLPVAEGLLAGCRVICSDIAAHWEVGAGRCRFVDLRQYGEQKLAEAIVASLAEPKPRRADLPELLAKNVERQYVALYGMLLSASAVPSASANMELAGSERQLL